MILADTHHNVLRKKLNQKNMCVRYNQNLNERHILCQVCKNLQMLGQMLVLVISEGVPLKLNSTYFKVMVEI